MKNAIGEWGCSDCLFIGRSKKKKSSIRMREENCEFYKRKWNFLAVDKREKSRMKETYEQGDRMKMKPSFCYHSTCTKKDEKDLCVKTKKFENKFRDKHKRRKKILEENMKTPKKKSCVSIIASLQVLSTPMSLRSST